MKHKHSNRILSRNFAQRKQLLQNLSSSLLKHRTIITTEPKAKELRKFIEPLITEAKQELTLHRRRHLLQQVLHPEDVTALVEVAATHAKRPGGYLRLTKLPQTRTDGAKEVRVDILAE